MDCQNSKENGHKNHAHSQTIPTDAPQWVINLIELRIKTGLTYKQIAEAENLSEKSVSNVFLCKSKNPGVDLVRRIIHALGGNWREIFGESDAVIGSQDLATLQAEADRLTTENEVITKSLNIANAEITILKEKIRTLESENKILSLKLEYEEKLVAVHDFYNKLKTNN